MKVKFVVKDMADFANTANGSVAFSAHYSAVQTLSKIIKSGNYKINEIDTVIRALNDDIEKYAASWIDAGVEISKLRNYMNEYKSILEGYKLNNANNSEFIIAVRLYTILKKKLGV